MRFAFYGPNLSRAGQSKGAIHVHTADCGDARQYGHGKRYGGEGVVIIEAQDMTRAMREFFCDFDGDDLESQIADCYLAPCVKIAMTE